MRLVPLDAFLLNRLVTLERDPLTAEMHSGPRFALRALAINGLAFALLDGGDVVAGGGLFVTWPGRAEAWQLTSRYARPRQLAEGVKLARQAMDERQRNPTFRRIEAHVRADEPYALSFIAGLGFEREGLLEKWDPAGRDVYLCSRIAGRVG